MMCSQCERAIGTIDGKIMVQEVYRHNPINDGDYCFCSIKCLLGWYQ